MLPGLKPIAAQHRCRAHRGRCDDIGHRNSRRQILYRACVWVFGGKCLNRCCGAVPDQEFRIETRTVGRAQGMPNRACANNQDAFELGSRKFEGA